MTGQDGWALNTINKLEAILPHARASWVSVHHV